MLDGKKGAAAMNSSLDELSTAAQAAGMALSLLIPGGILIKGLIAGLTMAATAYIKYTQAANEMADKLHKGYQGLSKAGGAAADGMTGVFKDAKKLGLSMNELDQMVSLVAENSKDFALLAGSVSEGRKQFANIGEAMAPARQGLMNLGMDMKDINEGTAAYLRMQTQTGRAQQMTTNQLAKGAQDYLKEMDGLAKLTGQSRSEMQAQRDRMMEQEQSAAKLRALEMSGNKEGADALKQLGNMLGKAGPKMQAAFNASITGNLASKDAQEANLASQGELARVVELVQNKQITAAEGADRVAKAMGHTADTVGTQLGQLNAYESSGYGNFAEQQKLRLMREQGFVEQLGKINKDQEAQMAGADEVTDQQNALILKQMEANKEMEKFIFKQIPNAQKHMMDLADAAGAAARALNRAFPDKKEDEKKNIEARRKAVEDAKIGGMMSDTMLNDMGMDFGNLSGADGGVFKGPESGYPVLMHGTEAIVPMDKLSGARKMSDLDQMMGLNKLASAATNNQQSVDNPDADKMEKFVKSMLKDTESLTKITDADLNRTKNFSLLQTKLFEKKSALMEDELELLDEQNEILEQMLEIAEKAGGKEAAAAMKKSFTMARMGMSGGSMGGMPSMGSMSGMGSSLPGMGGGGMTAGGSGMTAGGKPAAPGMGGGSGLTGGGPRDAGSGNTNDLLRFGGHSGSASAFEGLDDRLEKAVMLAASEYNSLTGKKLQINSAKRDPEDQVRLYQETVDAGRPGIGPTGMPVGRPGTSSHEKGLAVDIQNYNDPDALKALNNQGLRQVVPKDPVHFQLSGETGMIADGPDEGYQATLHGKEAVIPMQNNSGDFVKMFEAMAEGNSRMVAMMEEMVAAQKNSVDVQTKMLRAQS
jgi:hypothetical protein